MLKHVFKLFELKVPRNETLHCINYIIAIKLLKFFKLNKNFDDTYYFL